ncbi:helix-turn-helix domain-containing protein [Agriterribacter humi]|uniref:helix-turn-helix domain-containing protein n=1 Tax=Agriterribacter humi TaxID=1104781 RepID=UPI0012643DC9|nr:helix-turn-helix domain-containing protein [Agriterribacter humi]
MSGSTFRILKQCIHCGNMFEAQKVTTAYCSHKCNSAHYKLKKRLERKEEAEKGLDKTRSFKPKITALNRAMINDKEFLTVKEIAVLFQCSPKAVYSFIRSGVLAATNLGKRKTLIKRSNIDKLFS